MNLEKFTERARGFLQSAQTVAVRNDHQRITPAHVLKALLEDEQGMASGLIARAGGSAEAALRETEEWATQEIAARRAAEERATQEAAARRTAEERAAAAEERVRALAEELAHLRNPPKP